MTKYMQNRADIKLKAVKKGRNKLRAFYFGVVMFLSLVVLLVVMSATPVVAMEFKKPVKSFAFDTVENIEYDDVATSESRLTNASLYCQTDGALEEHGSTEHCNEYYLIMIMVSND
ncbi:hypothetical protein [Vibrio phage vB_VpaP_SJSY21]|nr:hypothetical protein [Vibrio phage vB_VpaP_SJSY21]